MDTDALLPPGSRVLHVGPPKIGSTALQAAIQAAEDRMREHGVVVAGNDPAGRRAV